MGAFDIKARRSVVKGQGVHCRYLFDLRLTFVNVAKELFFATSAGRPGYVAK